MPKGKQDRVILAMDLSLNGSAFAVLQVYSRTVKILKLVLVDNSKLKTEELPEKLANIYFNLDDLLQEYPITDIVREKGFHRFNTVTEKLHKVTGIVDFTLYCNNFTNCIEEVTPMTVKKVVGGSGKCTKEEVAEGILKYLPYQQRKQGIRFETNDLSDAVAVGITYAIKKNLIKSVTK